MADAPLPRLYDDLAFLWPLLSPPEDYEFEAEMMCDLLIERLGDRPLRVLELGAGGGHTLVHLPRDWRCVAVDLSESMLANCRALAPHVRAVQGDMRTVRLGETFDAVLIHDAVDYMTSEADVTAALETAAAHLAPGGIAVVAPTYVYETFEDHAAESDFNADDTCELTYFSYVHDGDANDTLFELILIYLLRRDGKVQVIEDRHICGLFAIRQWYEMLEAAGFEPETLSDSTSDAPHVLFVGTKR